MTGLILSSAQWWIAAFPIILGILACGSIPFLGVMFVIARIRDRVGYGNHYNIGGYRERGIGYSTQRSESIFTGGSCLGIVAMLIFIVWVFVKG